MDFFKVTPNGPLTGHVNISGAKNAALPILCASLLTKQKMTFTNLPKLQDIKFMLSILEQMGSKTSFFNNTGEVCADAIIPVADYDLVRKMRASVLVLGPLLARYKAAKVSLPGGCAIGTRPVDLHLFGMEKLGAKISLEQGYINAECEQLIGAQIDLPFPSVGATENILMAATLARGVTTLTNAAKEPEISDLANCLRKMGAKISGIGTSVLTIDGVDTLNGIEYKVMPDRIEAATYMIAAAITRARITLSKYDPQILESVEQTLKQIGVKVDHQVDKVQVDGSGKLSPVDVITLPFPDFPTDVQAQLMCLLCTVDGVSTIKETIFENRFMHVPELIRMGAKIVLDGNKATIYGGTTLKAAPVMATDLRASAGLVLAALVAEGETHIQRVYHIDRGYESIESKLSLLGAKIERSK